MKLTYPEINHFYHQRQVAFVHSSYFLNHGTMSLGLVITRHDQSGRESLFCTSVILIPVNEGEKMSIVFQAKPPQLKH